MANTIGNLFKGRHSTNEERTALLPTRSTPEVPSAIPAEQVTKIALKLKCVIPKLSVHTNPLDIKSKQSYPANLKKIASVKLIAM